MVPLIFRVLKYNRLLRLILCPFISRYCRFYTLSNFRIINILLRLIIHVLGMFLGFCNYFLSLKLI